MIDLIVANTGNIIAGAIVVLIVILALRSMWKQHKRGGGCNCGCAGCSQAGSCGSAKKNEFGNVPK